MFKKIKLLVIGLFLIGVGFNLSGCAGFTTAVFSSMANSKYEAINLKKESQKNIEQTYNATMDSEKQYPTGTINVVFEDLAVRMNPTFVAPAMYLDGSKYFSNKYEQTILSYAKQTMPDVVFAVKDKPDFNSQVPQLVLLPSYFDHVISGVLMGGVRTYCLTFAIFYYNSKYYLITNQTANNGDPVFATTVFANFFKDYYPFETIAFTPIFPAVKSIMLQAQNQSVSPYLNNWLNQAQQWQPAPIGSHKIAFKVTINQVKLPCVYNYHWTYNQKNSQGKKYEKTTPEWATQLKGIAPYLFEPEDSKSCKEIKKEGGNITQAIMEVYTKDWHKQAEKTVFKNWDKVKGITVGAENSTNKNKLAGE